MLRIRLQRAGKKNQPFFKMVVIEKKSPPKGGRPVEVVGFYNPLTKEKGLKEEKINHWLSVGAQPSDTVHNMLVTAGVIKGEKIDVHKKIKAGKKESAKPEAETQEAVVEAAGKEQEEEQAETPEKEEEKEEKEERVEKPEPETEPENQEEPKPEEKEETIDEEEKIVDKKE